MSVYHIKDEYNSSGSKQSEINKNYCEWFNSFVNNHCKRLSLRILIKSTLAVCSTAVILIHFLQCKKNSLELNKTLFLLLRPFFFFFNIFFSWNMKKNIFLFLIRAHFVIELILFENWVSAIIVSFMKKKFLSPLLHFFSLLTTSIASLYLKCYYQYCLLT